MRVYVDKNRLSELRIKTCLQTREKKQRTWIRILTTTLINGKTVLLQYFILDEINDIQVLNHSVYSCPCVPNAS